MINQALENLRLLKFIRSSVAVSNGIYGSQRVFLELREAGETYSKERVARLMRANCIWPVRGYIRKSRASAKLSDLIVNALGRQFGVGRLEHKVTDITETSEPRKAACT